MPDRPFLSPEPPPARRSGAARSKVGDSSKMLMPRMVPDWASISEICTKRSSWARYQISLFLVTRWAGSRRTCGALDVEGALAHGRGDILEGHPGAPARPRVPTARHGRAMRRRPDLAHLHGQDLVVPRQVAQAEDAGQQDRHGKDLDEDLGQAKGVVAERSSSRRTCASRKRESFSKRSTIR